jgi:hypothetical protein
MTRATASRCTANPRPFAPYRSVKTRPYAINSTMLAHKDTLLEDVKSERDKWARMAESLQEEKQKLLSDSRAGSRRGVWAWLSGRS